MQRGRKSRQKSSAIRPAVRTGKPGFRFRPQSNSDEKQVFVNGIGADTYCCNAATEVETGKKMVTAAY